MREETPVTEMNFRPQVVEQLFPPRALRHTNLPRAQAPAAVIQFFKASIGNKIVD